MAAGSTQVGKWLPLGVALSVLGMLSPPPARAQDCTSLLSLFQAGRSTVEIARLTGLTSTTIQDCRRELHQPVFVGPNGAPPKGAVGPVPGGAMGPPPVRAMGPPPLGAAGPPPVGHEVQRLP